MSSGSESQSKSDRHDQQQSVERASRGRVEEEEEREGGVDERGEQLLQDVV
ncbi:hypothetical protein OAV88_00025 [bacterium]|nr:hypothetical protein [bacterium]